MRTRVLWPLLLALVASACGREDAPEIVAGPYLLEVGPASATVMWVTSAPADGAVEVTMGEAMPIVQAPERTTIHQVRLRDLDPGTLYHYRVLSGSAESPMLSFRTAPEEAGSFTFAACGQAGGDQALVVHALLSHDPAFGLYAGALPAAGDAAAWERDLLGPAKALVSSRTFIPTPASRGQGLKVYCELFPTPAGVPWRYYRYGNAEVFSIDAANMAVGDEQYEWLRAALGRSKTDWKFVLCHPAVLGSGHEDGNARLRRTLLPLLLRSGADVLLSDGALGYERSAAIGTGASPEQNAIVCLATGGGAGAEGQGASPWTERTLGGPVVLLADVAGEGVTIRAVSLDGEQFDSVVLHKGKSGRDFGKALSAEALEAFLAFQPAGGFDMGEVGAEPVTRSFSVALENPYDTPIDAELRWETGGEAWTLEPAAVKIAVPPLGRQDVSFSATVRPPGIEPLPTFTLVAGQQSLKPPHSPFTVHPKP